MSTMKRILIIRLSAIGDIIMASALLPPLRATWPDAHISWLVEPTGADLLRGNPHLDELIVWPRNDWQQLLKQRSYCKLLSTVGGFKQRLRDRQFDLVLDIHGLLKSGLLAKFTCAPQRIGLNSREGSQWLMTQTLTADKNDARLGSEYLQLATALALDADLFAMAITATEASQQSIQQTLTRAGFDPAAAYVVLCPFTTRPQKHWFNQRWGQLIDLLHQQTTLTPILLGSPNDNTATEEIIAAATTPSEHIINMVGKTSIAEAVALVQGANLLIGVDTGFTHLGIAFNLPTIALFGATRPYLETGSINSRVLYQGEDLSCSPCRRRPTCNEQYFCMQRHTADNVFRTAQQLLQLPPASTFC